MTKTRRIAVLVDVISRHSQSVLCFPRCAEMAAYGFLEHLADAHSSVACSGFNCLADVNRFYMNKVMR